MSTTQQQLNERAAAIEAVFCDGQGYLTLLIVAEDVVTWFAEAATQGDAACSTALAAALELCARIEQRQERDPLPCWLCDDPLWCDELPRAVGVIVPFGIDAPTAAIGLAFCHDCATRRTAPELGKAALARLRQDWLPDLRALPPMPPAGHA